MADRDIVVDPEREEDERLSEEGASLVSWVMERVRDWEDYRNTNYKTKWNEYYRLWRGIWAKADKNRDLERSRLIAPALSQAIEAAVAELEEATFGGAKWFDVFDNSLDEDKTDIEMFRDQLMEDLTDAQVPHAMSEVFLNGAIYGTGIAKIVVESIDSKRAAPATIGESEVMELVAITEPKVQVSLVSVHPQEFVIDPSARSVDEAMGCAHTTVVPKHTILKKQKNGVYLDVDVGGLNETTVGNNTTANDVQEFQTVRNKDKTLIIEYHGLVPRNLLFPEEDEDGVEPLFDNEDSVDADESDLVEAIVTIANGSTLLRGIENPHEMKDRGFISYQHDTVPNRFWGRGVAEKGYNPQKALDAEMRGRIDAMTLTIHPMLAVDATRMNRGSNFQVGAGRTLLTNGDPNNIIRPFNFGQVNNNTFSQSGELERMVQMGTGSMDSATPLAENRRNETSSGMSMIMSGAVKRSKRTLANIERSFTKPLIQKAAWRYMQFAPDRYPIRDLEFQVNSTLGLIARELEQQQMAQMMQTVPPDSPAFWLLLKGVYENSSISNREEMLPVIDQMMQSSLQKQQAPEQEDPIVAVKREEIQVKAQIEQMKLKLKDEENDESSAMELEKLKLEYAKLKLKEKEIEIDAQLEAAKMQQDSETVRLQLAASKEKGEKPAPSAPTAPASTPQVINIGSGAEKKTKKKLTMKRVGDKFEGTSEEITLESPTTTKKKVTMERVGEGFEGISEDVSEG